MATEEFINALRRFIARRGFPETITCDNVPTFLLTENVLSQGTSDLKEDISHDLANKEIRWSHITPYAQWQGGFHERLIKSIKHSIYKALRGAKRRSLDDIHTFVTEVEACLNCRPLTYQGATQEALCSVRPIDFVQRDMTLSLPIPEGTTTEERDPVYLPPNELRQLQYQQQVINALHSFQQEVERFWNIWQQQYLLSLRDTHKKYVSNRRQGKEHPEIGDVVLMSDPVQPRNGWEMGRITHLRYGADDEVRKAELVTSTRRIMRRPINLLIPLEIQEARATAGVVPTDTASAVHEPPQENQKTPVVRTHSYDLRERKPMNYAQERVTATTVSTSSRPSSKWFLFYIMILSLTQITSGNSTFFMTREFLSMQRRHKTSKFAQIEYAKSSILPATHSS
ncbi:hypothetical protein ANCCEY_13528 [Ancylostoma ceylanicum]|uniref:Integrase catalytic domain-containing protein n=1 Tax=Ancylostoma ceylanicum TaxID=53326 RepID=A0A0D6L7C1_9BILA|nr:hypothetical protein ANCCEY_13528 [Ancylostoma ceylanicum]